MSFVENAALVHESIQQIWNRADVSALETLALPTCTFHLASQAPRGIVAMTPFLRDGLCGAFPDWRVTSVPLMAEGEWGAARWVPQAAQ